MIVRAQLVSFNPTTHTATIRTTGDIAGIYENVPCAAHLDDSQLTTGAILAVHMPDPGTPATALVLAARGSARADNTIAGSHNRLDYRFGPAWPGSTHYNPIAYPSSPNALDRECTSDFTTTSPWQWTVAPSSINALCGYSVSQFPHHLYVYMYGTGTSEAVLRCTTTMPRYKKVHCSMWTVDSAATFTMRACKDANNYIELLRDKDTTQAWKCIAGTRTQIDPTLTVSTGSAPLIMVLGNYPSADFLTWGLYRADDPTHWFWSSATDPGLRAGDIAYLELRYKQPNAARFARYIHDFIRFSST